MDRSAIEDLFERNADMRLLELRHSESGRTSGAVRHVGTGFGAESIVSAETDVRIAAAPRLRVAIATAPKGGLIAGALIGIAIDVFNDGTAPAPESKLLLALPIETAFRPGTLRVDGREVPAPERLFGDGLPVPRLAGETSAKIVFQLQVLPGLNPLYLQPRLQTNGVPVVGTPGVSVKRAVVRGTRIEAEPERPFYELDDDELSEVEGESAMPIVPPVVPPAAIPSASTSPSVPAKRSRRTNAPAAGAAAPENVVADSVVAEPVVEESAVAEPAVAEPLPEPPPAESLPPPKPARVAAATETRMSRFRTIAPKDIALLDRLFTGDEPGIIAHFVAISALVCNEPEHGVDTSGYAEFLRNDRESLGRALVLARFGKNADHLVAQSSLDALSLPWEPTPPPTTTPRRSPRRLRRDLSETECRALAALMQPSKRDAHLRLRIALLALAGATIEGVARTLADECVTALASYRSAMLAWLIPLCVASMTADAATLPQPPANLDSAARRVVAALRAAYAD